MSSRSVGGAIACALVVAFGCGDKRRAEPAPPAAATPGDAGTSPLPERTVVTRVEVKVVDPTRGPAREVYPRELAKRVGATLQGSPWFVAEGEQPPGVQLRPAVVELVVGYSVVAEGSTGEPAIIAVIEASVEFRDGRGGMRPAMNVLAERPYAARERGQLDGLVAQHVAQAVAEAAQGLIAKERARVGPPAEALALLDAADVDLRVWGLAVVGDRGLTDGFDGAAARLSSDEAAERDAALGALIALKDRRAVAAITHVAEFHDYEMMRRAIDAVGILGGSEAIDYLEFVATGHPDDDIKAQAADALRRLRRRTRHPARAERAPSPTMP